MRNFFFSSMGLGNNASVAPLPTLTHISFLGDSIAAGYGVSNLQYYPYLVSQNLSLTKIDGGLPGSCLQAGVNEGEAMSGILRFSDYINPNGLYVIHIGINDVGKGGTLAGYQSALNTMLDTLLGTYNSQRIVLCSLAWINESTVKSMYSDYNTYYTTTKHAAFNSAIQTISTQRNTRFCDLYTPFINQNSLLQDGIHPNAAGHVVLKNTILANL